MNLKKRFDQQGKTAQHFIIDNCCKWAKKLKEVFGEKLKVKLDLFHAVQRLTSQMNKRHPLFSACTREITAVFRKVCDIGENREIPTPVVVSMDILCFHCTSGLDAEMYAQVEIAR